VFARRRKRGRSSGWLGSKSRVLLGSILFCLALSCAPTPRSLPAATCSPSDARTQAVNRLFVPPSAGAIVGPLSPGRSMLGRPSLLLSSAARPARPLLYSSSFCLSVSAARTYNHDPLLPFLQHPGSASRLRPSSVSLYPTICLSCIPNRLRLCTARTHCLSALYIHTPHIIPWISFSRSSPTTRPRTRSTRLRRRRLLRRHAGRHEEKFV
jgi:hypothetical protein